MITLLWKNTVLTMLLVAVTSISFAATSPTCPNARLFSEKLITDICWDCMFPIRLGPVSLGGGEPPSGAGSSRPFCTCPPSRDDILPQVGMPVSFWEPLKLIEVVRSAYCSIALGGIRLQKSFRLAGGPVSRLEHTEDSVYYNYHMISFPLLQMLDLFTPGSCNFDGYIDFDFVFLSEVNPAWNDDELAFFIQPEVAVFSNPIAQAACIPDAAMGNVGAEPIKALYWCAGTWGSMYPFSGNVSTNGSPPRDSSLVSMRALALSHRMGLSKTTMGDDAMCGSERQLMLPKTQYKMSMFYPIAEANDSHWLGESTFLWGEWRNKPGTGEDFLYLIWSWKDCCMR